MKEGVPMEPGIIFQDKKTVVIDYDRITKHIQEAAQISKEADVSQEEATVVVQPEYPNLPIHVIWMTDIHYGSMGVDYTRLNRHLEIVKSTPNTYVIFGGDLVDNFSAAKHPVALMGDAISPQMQTQSMLEKVKELDRKSKVLAMGHGNHEDFLNVAGYDYWQTFMNDVSAPIFSKNGVLNLVVGRETYRIGIYHKFWGNSKINPGNRPKRAMEYGGFDNQEIVLIGDDHLYVAEDFDKNGSNKQVIDGGTYKLSDSTGKRWGLGPAGRPGKSICFYPNLHHFELVKEPEIIQEVTEARVFLENAKTT